MRRFLVIVLAFVAFAFAIPRPKRFVPSRGFRIDGFTPSPFRSPSPDLVSPHVLSLKRTKGSRSHQYLRSLQTTNGVNGVYGITPVSSDDLSTSFIVPITFANQTFEVILDTGSSDTWLAETGYKCADVFTQAPEPESYCDFGPTYNLSSTFKLIPNEYFNIEYGDGEFLNGIFGTEVVTLAGITVKNQQVAAANYAGWYGDGVASGLVGLAFPALTSAYNGTNALNDPHSTQIHYLPIFTNMHTEGNVAPMFILAINRNNAPGIIAFGGIPAISLLPGYASAPFQVLNIYGAAQSTTGTV